MSTVAVDVAIVGGGPAGLTAGVLLARRAIATAILAGSPAPRAAPELGETLPAAGADLWTNLGIAMSPATLGLSPVTGYESRWGSPSPVLRHGILAPGGAGWIVQRAPLLRGLVHEASKAGAVVFPETLLEMRQRDRAWTLRTDAGRHIRARFLLLACGRQFRGRWRSPSRAVIDRLVCVTAAIRATDSDSFVRVEAFESGWTYTVNADGTRVFSVFTDGDLLGRSVPRAALLLSEATRRTASFYELVAPEILDQQFTPNVVSAVTSFRSPAHGPGWVICGDCAQSIDPLSSSGIVTAVADATDCAQAVADHLHSPHDVEPFVLREQSRRERFARHLRARAGYYRAEQRWRDALFWQRRHDPTELARRLLYQ